MQSTLTNIDEMMALRAQKEKTHIEEKKEKNRLEIESMKSAATESARTMRVSPLTGR